MIDVLIFQIPGTPSPWRRTGGMGNRRFEKPESKSARALYQQYALLATRDWAKTKDHDWDKDSIYRVRLEFVFKRSGGRPKKKIRPRVWRPKRADVDNLTKMILDSLEGFLWTDDKQVVEIEAMKYEAGDDEQPHTAVYVATIPSVFHTGSSI